MLAFCSPVGFEILSKCDTWAVDGTFHVAAKYYYQLYIIQGWFMNRMIPCCFAFMNRRRTQDYLKLLKALVKEAKEANGFDLKPKVVMTDFESAAIKAFKKTIQNIEMKGCMFHFAQNIMKSINRLSLKQKYNSDENLRDWFKTVFVLAVAPPDHVDELWLDVLNKMPNVTNINRFTDYLVNNYFEGKFPLELWNHFNTQGPRTNNNLEGYNSKLKKHVAAAHPNIYKAIEKLKQEEVVSSVNFYKAINGERPPPRNKLDLGRDDLFRSYKKMFLDKDISLNVYVKYVKGIYDIEKTIEMKKKKKKDDKDDQESDDEDELTDGSDDDNEIDEDDD